MTPAPVRERCSVSENIGCNSHADNWTLDSGFEAESATFFTDKAPAFKVRTNFDLRMFSYIYTRRGVVSKDRVKGSG